MSSLSSVPAEFAAEQRNITLLYHHLDGLRDEIRDRLAGTRRHGGGTPGARSDRDTFSGRYAERLGLLSAVEDGLCFGRLDPRDGDPLHIGRIGLHDADRQLLVDWRAPAARPFYVATAITNLGMTRRRHIRTRLRTVIGLDDEILDAGPGDGAGPVVGEAALLAALTAERTGRMRDIVSTIQAEQDRVIRADLGGVLVVQGGPGTGKTAVALHRAAYLLYTFREQLASRGVLIVGPNATFLRYISQVLPSLAETGVLLATPGDLYPGVTARRPEPPAAAEIKGRAAMAEILQAGVRAQQRVPAHPVEIEVDRHVLRLEPAAVEAARERARGSGRLHNLARPVFAAAVLETLAGQVAERIGHDPFWADGLGEDDALTSSNVLDEADLADIRADLAGEPGVRAALDECWPVLTPEELLDRLFADPSSLPLLTPAERELLRRSPGGGWTAADVPLLDEAAELLGEDDRAARARAARELRRRLAYAQGVLDITAGSKSYELEDDDEAAIPNIADVMEADMLAEHLAEREWQPAAARAAADRRWAFGHVIVDEAQELSPMAWRLLMRRCPSRSMTVVGDLDQTGSVGAPASWGSVLAPFVADRWRLAELTVSYRTPAEILTYTRRALAEAGAEIAPPRPVRTSGIAPWEEAGDLDRLTRLVAAEIAGIGAGRLAVIAPAGWQRALAAALPVSTDPEERATLLTVTEAKGLEFDVVVVADPAGIVAESPRGVNDLYVALTRPTRRLGVFRPSPGVRGQFEGLAAADGPHAGEAAGAALGVEVAQG